ncbi:peptidylprolyl isomerase [Dokdonia sp. Hel_I_53]|uniref:peptidylprolyl isomerase n=1 Tax=Dokdonia sp. Hel_I_53 TaxID=1566287 RepID=UPI0011997BBC|nr:peptidylprolyl isomerase [Dokdonia sp. Hel_I_53]TVZ53424.1 cyclophilin family peptidyl-prolyl cis-trans isomerase [Dokdonia sp. Hel_I_53]
MKKTSMLLIAVIFSLFSCNDKYPDIEEGLYAEIVTDKGTMLAELFYKDAPATVANFVALAEGTHPLTDTTFTGKPFYNGLKFHRIIKDFMIQGGDPDGTGRGGPGYKFFDELSPDRKHDSVGTLSMANSGYGTNGSQFFITHKATPHLDGYDANGVLKNCENPRVSCHTVWGRVIQGLEVIDSIAAVEMQDPRAGTPKEDVIIQQVNIIREGDAVANYNAAETFTAELAAYEERQIKEEAEKAKKFSGKKAELDAKRVDLVKLPSGLEIHFDKKGKGQKPALGAKVKVDYAGYFTTGELFDTSMESVARANDKLDERKLAAGQYKPMDAVYSQEARLIAGFKEGLQQMSVGDKATLFIPYHLGYGEQGYPGAIPPKADLIFELELLEIVK